ncbi:phosphate regulon sensor kinase PhoR [Streptomyces viridochromogenes DSM 40736]|uniref:histidine kinase n=1 Tax=Streptomyces viridochromogenes (strain DSM 40736 / JCM 4977 / BCRC 1201 / Tue 494) TaxID=591159 RepID=D9X7M0_STRVT|nr:HAMP domain-containing sensor histidine kinase [Streptomyces viridochromogenes]EFL29916.1 phosphate regulon sensor kinase PhoR [Streptomyces viridochromogenes DSM 40736]
MSGPRPRAALRRALAARRARPASLRLRLTTGLVVLLAVACAVIGVATVVALESFLIGRIDQQLAMTGGRFAASLEHENRPDADNAPDTRGQADGTFGARLVAAHPTHAAVVDDDTDAAVHLTSADSRVLASLPTDGKGHSAHLSALPGRYRLATVRGDDGDVLVTGLPLRPVEETVHRLVAVEAVVFSAALAATAAAGAAWVRLSLRPLERVATTATEVTRLPLTTGEVAMPAPVPHSDTHTEVGRVATALNRMLGHVGDALARRHASEERLRHFAADASHELRTPIAAVRAHTDLALRHPGPLPHEVRHSLERIEATSRRMSGLVDDLLLLARLDAGRPLAREPVDLTRLALDAVDDARALSADHHWQLELPEEPVVVEGDEHRLHQVLANLLSNARIHTPPGTRVTLSLAPGSHHAEITVADDGPGIPEALQAEIFHRFTRADPGRSRRTGGTGLGLAIVDAVITAHHGTISVTSGPGSTSFRLRLPLAAGEDQL